VERENYLDAIARKYSIPPDALRKLVINHAAREDMTAAAPLRPKPTTGAKKASPQENAEKMQRLLLTWISEAPDVYRQIKEYISPLDFTKELYRQVAQVMFAEIEEGRLNPAGIISRFTEEETQREVAQLFNTKLPHIGQDRQEAEQAAASQSAEKAEREKALHDIVMKVKQNSYETSLAQSGSDLDALNRALTAKKELEALAKTHISLG
jgi:DNA primase